MWTGLLACVAAPAETAATGAFPVEHAVSEYVPTVVTVTWDSPEAGNTYVEYGLDGAYDLVTPATASEAGTIAVTLLGLKGGRTYAYRAVTVGTSGEPLVSDPGEISVEPPPSTFVQFTVDEHDPDRAQPGGFVLSSLFSGDEAATIILDRDGDFVWWYAATDGLNVHNAKFNVDNRSILFFQADEEQTDDLARAVRVPLEPGAPVTTRALLGHHDFAQLPNGDIAWLSLDVRTVMIGEKEQLVVADNILEIPEGSGDETTPTEVFNFFDDYVEPFVPCSHFWAEVYNTGAYDWSHGNSLMYDEARDAWWMMTKNFDALHHIDRATGTQDFQIGGLHSDYDVDTEANMWRHGHMSDVYEGGFAVFDNGYHREPAEHSGVTAYTIDEANKTVRLAFRYDDPDDRFVPLMGDIKRVGSTWLTSWSSAGMIFELDAAGEIVWRATADVGAGVGRATWVQDLYTLDPTGIR